MERYLNPNIFIHMGALSNEIVCKPQEEESVLNVTLISYVLN